MIRVVRTVLCATFCAACVSAVGAADRWQTVDLYFPGRLVAHHWGPGPEGSSAIVVLVELRGPDETPAAGEPDPPPCPPSEPESRGLRRRALFRLEPDGSSEPVAVGGELLADVTKIAVEDVDGDGRGEILVFRPGELLAVRGDGLESLVRDPGALWIRTRGPLGAVSFRPPALRFWRPTETRGPFRLVAEAAIDPEGTASPHGLRIRTPSPRFLGRSADGTLIHAIGPNRVGQDRLKTTRIELAPDGRQKTIESWARLPNPEDVLEQFLLMDGERPLVLVLTKPADKLSLFGEKRLRLFTLERDRSRLGLLPLLATESRMNLWQQSTPRFADANGDGLDDLVIGYWKGLKDSRVVLDVYLREGASFATAPKTTAFDVKDGDRFFLDYGADFDGDGLSDLLLRARGGFQVHYGRRSKTGAALFDRNGDEIADASIAASSDGTRTVGEFAGTADVDGDGRDEIVFVGARGEDESTPGYLRVVRLAATNGPDRDR